MTHNITLSASVRSNLQSLNTTTALAERTQGRLATGNKVNSALDDATAYFQAKALTDRATNFNSYKDDIDQTISTLTAASNATESVETILKQIKGLVISAKTADKASRKDLQVQVKGLLNQVNQLVNDASYQGNNLLNSTTIELKVNFSERSASFIKIQGRNTMVSKIFTAVTQRYSTLVSALLKGNFTDIASSAGAKVPLSKVDDFTKAISTAISNVQATASNIGSKVTFLQTRLDFTKTYVNALETGAGKLTLADTNEEGANLVSLQTRQQLALKALSFAGQSEANILTLFQ